MTLVKDILKYELKKAGVEVKNHVCEHFAYSRQELYSLVRLHGIKSFESLIAAHGTESRPHHQETARALAAAAPHGQLVVVDGASHGVHLTHPAAVADLVRRALARG